MITRPVAEMTSDEPMTFEEILERLERIVAELESGEPDLERSLALFEEGVKLSRHGTRLLDDAERKVQLLLADGSTVAMEVGGEGE